MITVYFRGPAVRNPPRSLTAAADLLRGLVIASEVEENLAADVDAAARNSRTV
jgi:hypothetical protein